ncbi:PRC-barrel domain-containing protein [Streptomyces sp. NEAU-H22]|uniref:PRC-barrel domain-containing protein n=1 Tax=unclassified Streptomyces TaxID=2593676 RepID=UPI00224E759A|nr:MULTISPECIES: PRC-barrel domain-containing protein [unclassified Streptomyces]MCX3290653.1 PRC-barrel domain-containing protein [Streptomyces sp. NEAU-H22]WMD06691.1 PRC-barrel domain-containing protein [Streptomyces sp. FXY-T5]
MMLFSEALGLPVLTLTEAEEVGVVRSLTVDAVSGVVTHVRVRGRHSRKETVLAWGALHAIGPDAVLVRSAAEPAEVPPHHELPGLRILTETGDTLGTVQDVAFEPGTGRVEAVVTAHGDLPADRVLGLGDYALVVRAA